jgi:hypothetical protein
MNKRLFLLHLALSLLLTTQAYAQDTQPAIIYNPDYVYLINPDATTTPDRTTTTPSEPTPTDTVDTVDTTNTTQPSDDGTTTEPETPINSTSNTPSTDTPGIVGPGPERPLSSLDPITPTTPPVTVTPTRPTRPTTPTRPTETPVEETPVIENCPLFNPLDQNPVKCPENTPIIPIFPIMMVAGPIAGLLLFFLIFKLLQNSHLKTESRLELKRQNNLASQRSSAQQQQSYQDYLDFLSTSLTQDQFNQSEFLKQQAQLELFGSENMLKLHQQVQSAFQENDHQQIKKLLPGLIAQIRSEE